MENEVMVMDEGNVMKLSREVDGRSELIFDFEKINGRVLLECVKQAKAIDKEMLIPNLSIVYQAVVGAKACGLRYDDILNLPGSDFMAVTTKVLRFLNGSE